MKKGRALWLTVALLWYGLSPTFAAAERGPATRVIDETVVAQTTPERPSPSPAPIPGLPKSERMEPQTSKTEQYTLSEDRYEKAVAYSRAGYTLYFVSYLVSITALLLLLRLGVAARFRDFAERVTARRWLQAFV